MDSKQVLSLVGSKFYRYDDNDNLDLVRITGMQNVETVKLLDLNTKKETKVNPQTILDNYKMLKPDGLVIFSLVSVDAGNGTNMDDVIITLHKMSALEEDGDNVPYAVCRQNVNDIFYDKMCPTSNTVYAGCCISKDTCPEHIDYRIMTSCNGVQLSYGVNVYIDDTLDDILGLVKITKFDKALENIYNVYLKNYTSNPFISRVDKLDGKSLHGYSKNVRTLLEENNFMYDFNVCFGVTPLDFELSFADEENEHLSNDCKAAISLIYRANIVETYVIPYAKDIDASKIQMNYMIVRTPSNKLYYIGYTTDGRDYVESEEAMEQVMSKMHGVLAHNGEKYAK